MYFLLFTWGIVHSSAVVSPTPVRVRRNETVVLNINNKGGNGRDIKCLHPDNYKENTYSMKTGIDGVNRM